MPPQATPPWEHQLLEQALKQRLGALGHYALDLGELPLPRFIQLASDCHRTLRAL